MRLSISSRSLRLYRSAIHPAVSILLPLLFLAAADQLLRALLPGAVLFPRRPLLLLLAAGIEEAFLGNLLFRERSGFAARLREIVLLEMLLAAGLHVAWAVRHGGWLRPALPLVYPALLVLVQWLLSLGVHGALREREILLQPLAGLGGEALRHSLRDSSYQAAVVVRALRSVRALLVSLQIMTAALLLAAALLPRAMPAAALLAVLLHCAGSLVLLGVLNHLLEEQRLLGDGLTVPFRLERRRLAFMLLMAAAAAGVGLAFARDSSLLPLSLLLDLLQRLLALLRLPWRQQLTPIFEQMLLRRQRALEGLLQVPQSPPSLALVLAVELLRRLFVTLAGAGVFLFLAAPLLSEEFRERLRELKPLQLVARALLGFTRGLLGAGLFALHALRALFRLLTGRPAAADPDEPRDRVRGRPAAAARRPLGARKRLQMGRVLRAFLALVRWGEGRGIRCLPSHTAGEYAALLLASLAARRGDEQSALGFVVEVFEEAMFSAHLLPARRVAAYLRAARALRRSD